MKRGGGYGSSGAMNRNQGHLSGYQGHKSDQDHQTGYYPNQSHGSSQGSHHGNGPH